jgi:hypothetical protein
MAITINYITDTLLNQSLKNNSYVKTLNFEHRKKEENKERKKQGKRGQKKENLGQNLKNLPEEISLSYMVPY